MKRHIKKIDFWLLGIFPILATVTVLYFGLNYFQSILVFFLPTAAWLSYRNSKVVLRTLIFAGVFTVPIAIIVNYVAVASGAWNVPKTIFPIRYLNILPLEDVIMGFLLVYSVVLCFEHFLDKGRHNLVDGKMKYFILFSAAAIVVFLLILASEPKLLEFRNAYIWLGLIFIVVPIISAHSIFPRLVSKYIKVGLYFSLVLAMFEYAGVALDHWVFADSGIFGSLYLFSKPIPYEELIFWVLLGGTAIISYYEFFDDGAIISKS
jgi:hypothetical protein